MPEHGFSHEKLHVYNLALDFLAWVTPLLDDVRQRAASQSALTRDHLDRGSLSVVLNIAEGNGKLTRKSRRAFFDIARGSATECAACLDSLVAKRLVEHGQIAEGKAYLIRIVQMLTKMIGPLDADEVREEQAEYRIDAGSEDEDDEKYRSI